MNKQTVADSPSLRLRLAKPGPWLLDSSEELVKEARGKEDARGASQLSGGKKHRILVSTLIDASLSSLPVFFLPFYFHPLLIPLPLSVFFILNCLSFNQQARKALEPVVSISLGPRFISEPLTPAKWERLSLTHGLYCSPCQAGHLGSSSRSGRSPGGENGNPLQYSAWQIPWTEELQSMESKRVRYD